MSWATMGEYGREVKRVESLLAVLREVELTAVRDPTPHSSAWLIPASTYNLVAKALYANPRPHGSE